MNKTHDNTIQTKSPAGKTPISNGHASVMPEPSAGVCFISLTQGQVAIVDAVDYDWLNQYKWHAQYSKDAQTWYAFTSIYLGGGAKNPHYATLSMHQLIMGWSREYLIDHTDHNGLNNQRCNLRKSTRSQNNANRKCNVGRKFKGALWHKRDKLWFSRIRVNKKAIHLGRFASEIEAAKAYDEAAIKYHGEFAYLNFPKE